jgi:hypothetical protein
MNLRQFVSDTYNGKKLSAPLIKTMQWYKFESVMGTRLNKIKTMGAITYPIRELSACRTERQQQLHRQLGEFAPMDARPKMQTKYKDKRKAVPIAMLPMVSKVFLPKLKTR